MQISMKKAIFPTFFIIYHKLNSNLGVVGPGDRLLAALAIHVTWVSVHHYASAGLSVVGHLVGQTDLLQNHNQKHLKSIDLNNFHPTFKPTCLEIKNYTSFPITDQSILSKQFEVPKLSFPLDKMPPNSLDLQKCFGNQVISCYKSTIQNSAYNVNDLCNCNGYTVANVNPYLKENKAENTLLQMNCQLSTNN